MIKQSLQRDSGVFTPDESDHINIAVYNINNKINAIQAPNIDWHYNVIDIQVENAINNNSILVGKYLQLNFAFNKDVTISFAIPDVPITAVDKESDLYTLEIINSKIHTQTNKTLFVNQVLLL